MTREERIDWLCRLRSWVVAPPLMTAEQKSKFIEALTETIEALQTEPCEDCISRQAVLDKINEVCFSDEWLEYRLSYGSNGERDYIIKFIEWLPSVQPEQRTGTWKIVDVLHGEWEGTKKYACDKCGEKVGVFKSNYCPNCGRRMGEGE